MVNMACENDDSVFTIDKFTRRERAKKKRVTIDRCWENKPIASHRLSSVVITIFGDPSTRHEGSTISQTK